MAPDNLYCVVSWRGFNINIFRKVAKVDKQINTKMMRTLVMLLFIFVLASLAAGEDNPLMELLSNRDEVVHIAGYGEEKLSTVLITGSVSCEAPDQLHAWPLQGTWISRLVYNQV